MSHLYYGDNLKVLRDSLRDESIDLIYLDPPFNSNASCNVLFKGPQGTESAAQIKAFDDTWHWNETAEAAFTEVVRRGNAAAAAGRFTLEEFSNVPRLQIVTIEAALALRDRAVQISARRDDTFRRAAPEANAAAQGKLEL